MKKKTERKIVERFAVNLEVSIVLSNIFFDFVILFFPLFVCLSDRFAAYIREFKVAIRHIAAWQYAPKNVCYIPSSRAEGGVITSDYIRYCRLVHGERKRQRKKKRG